MGNNSHIKKEFRGSSDLTVPTSELKNPEFHARLASLIDQERPFPWAAKIGISNGAFSRIWNEGTIPSSELLIKISAASKCSIDWLLTGKGPAYQNASAQVDLDTEWTRVPQYKARLSAGPGSFIENGDGETVSSFTFKTAWLHRKCQPNACGCFRVSGDSMSPVIQDSDVVLVDMTQNDVREVREGKIYAFSEGDLIRVKRLIYKGSGELWAISDNKQAGPDSPIDMATFALIGRVIWVGHEVW